MELDGARMIENTSTWGKLANRSEPSCRDVGGIQKYTLRTAGREKAKPANYGSRTNNKKKGYSVGYERLRYTEA